MEFKKEHSDVSTSIAAESGKGSKNSKKRLYQCVGSNNFDDDFTDKKRRLTSEQINYLEMSFNVDVKLEPERKARIAKELSLRPRQVAIWFQNRRARWKNKQVEQDFELLKVQHDAVVMEKENLIKEYECSLQDNKRLQAEVDRLTSLLQGEKNMNLNSVLQSMKEEQPSSNSELMSPTKSVDCQSEIDDIFRPAGERKVVMTNLFSHELNGTVACALRAEVDCPFFTTSDNVHSSLPMLVQQLIANGHCLEDAYNIYLGCEYVGGGWR